MALNIQNEIIGKLLKLKFAKTLNIFFIIILLYCYYILLYTYVLIIEHILYNELSIIIRKSFNKV